MSSSEQPRGSSVLLIPTSPPPGLSPLQISRKMQRTMLGLAVAQICMAVIAIIWLTVILADSFHKSYRSFLMAMALVVLLIVTGSIGIKTSKTTNRFWVIPFLVLCLLSAAFACVVIIVHPFGAMRDHSYHYYMHATECEDSGITTQQPDSTTEDPYNSYWRPFVRCDEEAKKRLMIAMYVMAGVCFFTEMVIAIIASVLSCQALRTCCRREQGMQIAYMLPLQNGDELQGLPGSLVVPSSEPNLGQQTKKMYQVKASDDVSSKRSNLPAYIALGDGQKCI